MTQPPSFRPQAVLFDFDGTLADSFGAIAASVNHVRATQGLPELPEPEVRKYVGHGLEHLLEQLVPGSDAAENVRRYRAHHVSVMQSGTRLLPGVEETLRRLHAAGMRLGVCSNKLSKFTRSLIDGLGLSPLVGVVVGPEDVARLKPAPDMLLAAMRTLQVTPAQTLYVGDMHVDIETARAADVRVWAVPSGSQNAETLRAAQPDRLLEHFTDIQDVIRT